MLVTIGSGGGVGVTLVEAVGVGDQLLKGESWRVVAVSLLCSSRFLALFNIPSSSLLLWWCKMLTSVTCGSFRASALGKCLLQTQWWSLMTTSWRPSASIYRCRLALSWGKQCIDTLCLSLEYSHKQRTYLQAIMATPRTLQPNKVTWSFFHRKYQTRALNWFAFVLLGKTVQWVISVRISNLPVLSTDFNGKVLQDAQGMYSGCDITYNCK